MLGLLVLGLDAAETAGLLVWGAFIIGMFVLARWMTTRR